MPRSPTRALPLRIVGFLLVLLVVALTMRSVAAQSPGEKPESEKPSAAAPGDPPKSFGMSLREMLAAGGTIGWVIIGLSVAMVALMFQQMLTLRYVSLIPPGLPEQTHALIQQGLLRQAEQTCQESQSFLGNMLANALAEAPLGYAAMNKAMEDSAAEQSARLLRRVDYFSVIGTLAPMLGLLGTVWGMILAFMEFEQKANPQVSELAPGIYKALVTTLQGLTVAIPALALFAFFRNRVDELVAQASLMAEHIFADFRRARAARRREQRNKRRRRPGPNSGPSASPPASARAAGAPAMRIPSSVDRSSLQFNITPLIDVVFQLIIFFLVASYFVKNEVNEPVQLPEATQRDEEEEETPRRIVITVAADESWFLGNIPTTLAEIERRIADGADKHGPDFEVRLRGDRAVPFSAVEPVMVACAKAGVQRLKFAVEFRK